VDPRLEAVLTQSRRRGFLGPGALDVHVEHTHAFAAAVGREPNAYLDLGSGGGIPGLALALDWPRSHGVLLDGSSRRCEFLKDAVTELGLAARVEVVCERAEEAARRVALRGRFPVVVARSFGAPAVTAECATGFLSDGGRLVVSEPPSAAPDRWPSAQLATLGLAPPETRRDDYGFAILRRTGPLSDRWPRRVGIPAKRPLW
jgi:16S rRNA (guanine527-N7)-methyltransferase